MKKVYVLCLCLALLGVSANAAVLMDDGLTATPGAWTKVGTGPNPGLENDRGGPDGKDWNVGGADGSGSSAPYDVYYSRSFALAPGVYDIAASGWCKAWAGWWSGENWGWVQESSIEVYADGALIASETAKNETGKWDTWLNFNYAGTVAVASELEVRLHAVKGNNQGGTGGLGAIYYSNRFDDIYLSANAVPEPSPLLALFTGAAGLAGFAARKRR